MKNVRRNVISICLLLFVVIMIIGGSSFAWFSNGIQNGENVITVGNLEIASSVDSLSFLSNETIEKEIIFTNLGSITSDVSWNYEIDDSIKDILNITETLEDNSYKLTFSIKSDINFDEKGILKVTLRSTKYLEDKEVGGFTSTKEIEISVLKQGLVSEE